MHRRLLILAAIVSCSTSALADPFRWSHLPPLPDEYGFAGMFSGVSGGALILAGGSNIPEKEWGKGEKTWYDDIWVLEPEAKEWIRAGKLPHPAATGVSASTKWGVIMAGGVDGGRGYGCVHLVRWDSAEKKIVIVDLPEMPEPRGQMTGGLVNGAVYVACGAPTGGEEGFTKSLFRLKLPDPEEGNPDWTALNWETLERIPGPERALAAGAVQSGKLYVISGYRVEHDDRGKVVRQYMKDAYTYQPGSGWERVADLPRPALGAPATGFGDSHIFVFGGHDGQKMDLIPVLKADWPGFRREVLAYHTITDTWTEVGETPDLSSVKANPVHWRDKIIIPNGEIKARIRTNRVWEVEVVPRKRSLGVINTGVIVLYLLTLVGMGFYFARREKTTGDFFLGGRRVPGWAAGISIFGTQLSSIAFMAIPAKVYATDWAYFVGVICIVLVQPIIVYLYLPFFRRLDITTAYEYLEVRFNVVVRLFGSVSFTLYQLGRMTVVLLLPSMALSAVTGFNIYLCVVLMGLLATVYTVLGGIEAVIWTDVLQVFVLVGGALVSLGVILFKVGGFGPLFETGLADGKFNLANLGWTYTQPLLWVLFVGWMFQNLVSYSADQAVVQRYLVTKDERAAANAIWTNAACNIPVALVWYFLGTSLYVFYKVHPDLLDPVLRTDQTFPLFIAQQLPVGVVGLLIAGLFAASMSTVDSSMNSIATAVTTDFYKRFKSDADDHTSLGLARAITVLAGMIGTGLALWLAARGGSPSLWDFMVVVLGLLMSSLTGIFMLGIFTRRSNGPGALVGAAAGTVSLYVVKQTDVHFFLYTAVGIVVCFVVGYFASLCVPTVKPADPQLTIFGLRQK